MGCTAPLPPLPLRVVVDGDFSAEEVAAFARGADTWNGKAPGLISELTTDSSVRGEHVVRVVRRSDCAGRVFGRCRVSYRVRGGITTTISMCPPDGRTDITVTFLHEIGHAVFGEEHSDDPGEIMFPRGNGRRISDAEAQRARDELADRSYECPIGGCGGLL